MFAEIKASVSDELFAQLRRCPVDRGELAVVLKGLNIRNVKAVSEAIGASELMLRDPEELADAMLEYGFCADRIIEILVYFKEREIGLRKVFE